MNASSRLAVVLALMAASAFAQNLHPNPDFDDDQGASGWSAEPGSVEPNSDDASGCPASGSLVATTEELSPLNHVLSALGPCVTFIAPTRVDARLVYRGSVGPGTDAFVAISTFADSACLDIPDGGVSVLFQSVPDWTLFEDSFEVSAGGSLRVGAIAAGDSGGFVAIDEIRVTLPGSIFFDGFEGGGTCRWSAVGGEEPGRALVRTGGAG